MSNIYLRTEDIQPEDLLDLFVETRKDREIIDSLKTPAPIILVGSRGVGKSFLLRIAESELNSTFAESRILPVYISFTRSSFLGKTSPEIFTAWMIGRIASRIVRVLKKKGLITGVSGLVTSLTGESECDFIPSQTKIEKIVSSLEENWQNPSISSATNTIPNVDTFVELIEDVCAELDIKRISLFIDEAAHVFLKEQQRQFFTTFRDLRSPYLTSNAAVYPGVTSYGSTFQPDHDATLIQLERDVLDPDYVAKMKELVSKQVDSSILKNINQRGEIFSILAYAASGNPRLLLKTISLTPKIDNNSLNETIREFYKSKIWAEHTSLYEKYSGYKEFLDWGRNFIEDTLLPDLYSKNTAYLNEDKNTTAFFWVHRESPPSIKLALDLLIYTGIISEHSTSIKASRSEIGNRYIVNLGCLFAMESKASTNSLIIAKGLTPKRMTEYGKNHSAFSKLSVDLDSLQDPDIIAIIRKISKESISKLDISESLQKNLRESGFFNIEDILKSTTHDLQRAHYVGPDRAEKIKSSAMAAVYEYISG